jgi:hypothetical protein
MGFCVCGSKYPWTPCWCAKNQCDGCNQKLLLRDGIHWRGEKPWIGCTASRYQETSRGTGA